MLITLEIPIERLDKVMGERAHDYVAGLHHYIGIYLEDKLNKLMDEEFSYIYKNHLIESPNDDCNCEVCHVIRR